MTFAKDADIKTRALLLKTIETSKDCPISGDCSKCMMQLENEDCGSIKLREVVRTIQFVR